MHEYEVIVVGAGPAGCAAAYDLAAAGIAVLLADIKSFPRPKPCAGALTIKTVRRLRYSIAPVIISVARALEASFDRGRRRTFTSAYPVAVMTLRQDLDAYCLKQTIARGAVFRQIAGIVRITEDDDGVRFETEAGESFACRYLIGADGANSRVRRLIGETALPRALAIEGHVAADIHPSRPAMRFDFGYVPGGYGWVFAKDDHWNVGLYGQGAAATFTKADLVGYASWALGTDAVERMAGYAIGIGGDAEPKQARIFLVGDAAGFTDRLLGEGIHNAIATGQAAAQAIGAALANGANASRHFRAGLEPVRRDLAVCTRAARWFYDRKLLGLPRFLPVPGQRALMRGFAAGKTVRDIMMTGLLPLRYPVEPVAAVEEFEAV